MLSPRPSPISRVSIVLAGGCLFAALAWLICRVRLGLDFGDEMQYYGEISALTRTGRFFQDDLFLQQLGYIFVLPFFKLHAFFFPDQSYLIVFGRLLLLTFYGVTGGIFWRAATKLGQFSLADRIAGLAAFFAWVPLQIFAFSYNTTPYLLIVVLVSVWLTRDQARYLRYAVIVGALLTLLTYTHPPSGLALILIAAAEALYRFGWRAALMLLGTTLSGGCIVLGVIFALNGTDFLRDLLESLNFSRAFNVGALIRTSYHFTGWLILICMGVFFAGRIYRGRAFPYPLGAKSPAIVRWLLLTGLVVAMAALLGLIVNWKAGYLAVSACLGLLLILAASVEPSDGQRPLLRLGNLALLRWVLLIALGGTLLTLLLILTTSNRFLTGHCATTIFAALLIILAVVNEAADRNSLIALAVIGSVTGAVFAYSSGNGLPNFGMGAAGLIPFLTLYASRSINRALAQRAPALAVAIVPGLILFFLHNGLVNLYGEQTIWDRFQPIKNVPAFQGLRTSPLKVRAVEIFQRASPWGALHGKRVVVLGSHPWLYFVLGGQPTTPILFMKFDGDLFAYELAARRLSLQAPPDVVVLTQYHMPPPIADWVRDWSRQAFVEKNISLPIEFTRRFEMQTWCFFSPNVFILTRQPPPQ